MDERLLCEWCGEPETADRPIKLVVVSPPVDGFDADECAMHLDCSAEAARAATV